MEFKFIKVESQSQIIKCADTAKEIWFEYYPPIITEEQTRYMVETFQSPDTIDRQINNEGYRYYLFTGGLDVLGYFSIKPERSMLFLSKLYIKKEHRGKGYFSRMLSFIEGIAREESLSGLYLTVNRHNDDSIAVYRKKGFTVTREQVADIGNGYVMDDYVMEKQLIV